MPPPRRRLPPAGQPRALQALGASLPPRLRNPQLLGCGQQGVVLAAHHAEHGLRVVIKALRPELGRYPHDVARLRQESTLLRRMESPGIPRVVDQGTLADGRPWFAMTPAPGAPLDPSRAALPGAAIVRAACRILQHAHDAGVIHRDLKPEHIWTDGRRVEIIDWGAATAIEGASSQPWSGTLEGSPAFMSPEHARGEDPARHHDLWSMGATLWTVLTGSPPHTGSGDAVLERVRRGTPPRLDADTARGRCRWWWGLLEVARRTMSPALRDRPASAEQLGLWMDPWLDAPALHEVASA